MQKAVVVEINVDPAEIEAFKDQVKTIHAKDNRVASIGEKPNLFSKPAQATPPAPSSLAEAAKVAAEAAGVEVKEVNLFNQPDPNAWRTGEEEVRQEEPELEFTSEVLCIPPALATIETQVGKAVPGLFKLYQEASSLLEFAKARVITTAEDLKPATNDLSIILTCRKAMTARKAELVGPLKAKLDLVNKAFNDIMYPVVEADRLTRDQVQKFDREQRARSAAAKRIEEEKFRLAQEEASLKQGEITIPLGTVEEVAPPPERTRTDLGTLGGRDNWKARVVSFKDLDDAYKLPDMQTLNAKARSSKGTAVIPGVEFYNERSVTVRTR